MTTASAPRTTLGLILQGMPPEEEPLARAVSRVEAALERVEQALRHQAAPEEEA